jgi:hypothetical protein
MYKKIDTCCIICGCQHTPLDTISIPVESIMRGRCDICGNLDDVVWAREFNIWELPE